MHLHELTKGRVAQVAHKSRRREYPRLYQAAARREETDQECNKLEADIDVYVKKIL
jgi:hypothetical protein